MADEINNTPAQPGEPQQPQTPEPPVPPAAPQPEPIPTASYPASPQQPYGQQTQPQQPYGGYMPPQPYPTAPVPGTPGSGKALGALICGICAILFSGTVIVGIVLGIVAIVLASQYVKAFGKEGKATGGKVCGIVGIVFSVLALVGYLVLGLIMAAAYNEYNTHYYDTPAISQPATPADPAPSNDLAADETAVKELVETTLNDLNTPNADLVASVAEKADAAFVSSADSSLADAGVQPEEFAKWLLGSTSVKITSSDVFVSNDGTAIVYADVRSNNMVEFNDEVYDLMEDYAEQKRGQIDDAEYAKKLAEFVPAAMKTVDGEDSYVSINLEKAGSEWVVDDASLQEAIDQMLSLY